MTSRERVAAAFAHEEPDCVPLFELGLNPHFIEHFGGDVFEAYAGLGCDLFPFWPVGLPDAHVDVLGEEEWADEFGRRWRRDHTPRTHGAYYVGGMVRNAADLERYLPPARVRERLPESLVAECRRRYPDHALAFMFHGPFELAYEGMGTERFCWMMYDNPRLVRMALEAHTEWYIELAYRAMELGLEVAIIGDDSAFKSSSFISPKDYANLVIPCYRRIVREVDLPFLWHSDGHVTELLPLIIEAGIVGVHPLEPTAGMDLGEVKRQYGRDLVLIGNVCVSEVLPSGDMARIRADVERCMRQAKAGGGYLLSSSNSLHAGIEVESGLEAFRYAHEVGRYR